jgi:hypothetical protein
MEDAANNALSLEEFLRNFPDYRDYQMWVFCTPDRTALLIHVNRPSTSRAVYPAIRFRLNGNILTKINV